MHASDLRLVRRAVVFTALAIVPPWAVYGIARFAAALPDRAAWIATGAPHGPWYGPVANVLVRALFLPNALGAFLVLIVAGGMSIRMRSGPGLALTAALIAACIASVLLGDRHILWVVR